MDKTQLFLEHLDRNWSVGSGQSPVRDVVEKYECARELAGIFYENDIETISARFNRFDNMLAHATRSSQGKQNLERVLEPFTFFTMLDSEPVLGLISAAKKVLVQQQYQDWFVQEIEFERMGAKNKGYAFGL